jgi:hypothetical protein
VGGWLEQFWKNNNMKGFAMNNTANIKLLLLATNGLLTFSLGNFSEEF